MVVMGRVEENTCLAVFYVVIIMNEKIATNSGNYWEGGRVRPASIAATGLLLIKSDTWSKST